ncbi:MAG: leucine-rich repeat protein [Ruminococcaceae bacterium]|nr:leucine-rich repeat protein [Oscillospiraceae bacterium]
MKKLMCIKSYNAKQRKGFTLMELLIVVAIISVLVAIAIPVVTEQLDKARESVDLAHERSAKGAAVVEYLFSGGDTEKTYYFDASTGRVDGSAPAKGYGKSAVRPVGSLSELDSAVPKGRYVKVTVYANGDVKLWWEGGSGGGAPTPTTATGGLYNGGTATTWEDLTGASGPLMLDNPNVGKWAIIGIKAGESINGNLYIKEGLTDITQDVFKNQTGLKQVYFPDTMKVLGSRSFQGSGLTEVTIPNNINDMGQNVFSDLNDLSKVTWHYNPASSYASAKYLFTGSASTEKKITIDFYGTQAEWDSVKSKTGLSENEYILNLRS